MQAVAGLSSLTRLHLGGCINRHMMPGCKELACLRSASLEVVTMHFDQVRSCQ